MTSRSRRLVAAATTFIVVWTSLWSLVSAAHASLVGEEVMLCHQAGSMVAMGEMPMKQGGGGKSHCPLCIMAFYGSAAQPIEVPPLQFSILSVRLETYVAPAPSGQQVPLPPSRAPPPAAAA